MIDKCGSSYFETLPHCSYGQAYAVEGARKFVKKVKNAQEAHEAIRPTDIRRLPCKYKLSFLHVYTINCGSSED